ncbi:putative pectinesterase/pectinesterase inhibitor 32 [Ananas comosus]|uniref:Pectinesterase n=1 Tax=Ananas comosus TaxID=4615 RepID=A0A199W2A1_ANACO|nr:putative pectinesterase/pectinesterase inhibitor 32 [Ananas comosus]
MAGSQKLSTMASGERPRHTGRLTGSPPDRCRGFPGWHWELHDSGSGCRCSTRAAQRRYIIHIRRGTYDEYVSVDKPNVVFIGDGMGVTVITGNHSVADGWTTFNSGTAIVSGPGFIARDLTIRNTAGPMKGQAVALRSSADLSVFYRCSFEGYQDTLYAHSDKQFYRECRITGTVDFIFGDAAAVFQFCLILARRPLPGQENTITAQGRYYSWRSTGFTIQNCNISADSDLAPYIEQIHSYLGRPWKNFSRTVIMETYIGSLIRPEGWLEWNGSFALDTLYYGEYKNSGPGSGLRGRVKWPGYHIITDPAVAANFMVARLIDGDSWLPSTGISYKSGL